MSDASEAIFKWSVIFSILLSFFKVKVYGEILQTLRILSFVVHLPMVGVFLSGMALNVFHRFHKMATYDILEADGIIEGVFSFDEEKREDMEVEPIYEKLGYESKIAFVNMATMGLILMIQIAQFIALPVLFLLKKLNERFDLRILKSWGSLFDD